MMRRWWIPIAVLLLLGGAAAAILHGRRAPQWTTRSPAALAELEKGFEAEMKYYGEDAREHYRRALALDPDFVIAKLRLLSATPAQDKDTRQRLIDELRKAHTAALRPRERLLVEYFLARADKENARADKLLSAYLDDHPTDPFALSIRCGQAWTRGDFAEAEACNKRLLDVDPNWVQAQNQLGYLAMGQGHFAEAERLFRTYLFIAPDQANPHDSLGELLTVVGRYPEAEHELEEAARIKPNFCAAWSHLILLHLVAGELDPARATLARVQDTGSCPADFIRAQSCRLAAWTGLESRDYGAAWAAASACGEKPGDLSVMAYRVALLAGQGEVGARLLAAAQQEIEYPEKDRTNEAVVAHMAGLQELQKGDAAAAAKLFAKADQGLEYWSDGVAILKLFNRLDLAAALRGAGRTAEAQRITAEVAAVNASFAGRFADAPPRPR